MVGPTQSMLRLLHLLPEFLDRTLVLRQVLPVLLLEDLHEMLHDALIEVLPRKVPVAVRRRDVEAVVSDEHEQRNVKGAASEVIHQN
mmetsp:Transcript_141275/g.393739  ORF Transcript_141275/g.393739 Transcript_141275/m.393739 type:complete len:87 (+) Transcript_141275:360-620(+)